MSNDASAARLVLGKEPILEYRRLWEQGRRPELAGFLAAVGGVQGELLNELLDVDQWHRWRAGECPPAEVYLRANPALWDDPEHALRLVYGEFLLREQRGEAPAVEEFCRRFPALAARLGEQVELHRALANPDTQAGAGAPAVATPAPLPGAPEIPGYEILAELGHGGMGVVYQARQLSLRRLVALKVLSAAIEDVPEAVKRFRVEAEAAARLQHANIVSVFEVGECGGRPYMALEYVQGGTLAQRLNGTPMPPAEAAGLVETLSRAVHYAHQSGVIHRDLKPANVMMAETAQPQAADTQAVPKITDFGLARQLDAGQGDTRSEAILGTPSYMAPEQAAGDSRSAGAPADIYALGVTLYECLTGRPPFVAANLLDTLVQVRFQEPVDPARLQPGVPADLATVCLKCLRKEPHKRYASAQGLADDLRRFREGRPIRARPVGLPERAWKWAKRHPAAVLLGAATLASTILGLILVVAEQRQRGRAEERAEQGEWSAYLHSLAAADRAWQNNLSREARAALTLAPLKKRDWEWHLAWRRGQAELLTLRTAAGAANAAAFSPDGKLFATAGSPGQGGKRPVTVWDAASGRVLFTLGGHSDPVTSLAFGKGGTLLAAASHWKDVGRMLVGDLDAFNSNRGKVLVWDVKTRRVHQTLDGVYGSVSFSDDGSRIAAAGRDRMARVWDTTARPWKELAPWPGYKGVVSVKLTPDGTRLVTMRQQADVVRPGNLQTSTELAVWDVADPPRRRVVGQEGVAEQVAISPDGRLLASACRDRGVRLWDLATGREVRALWGHGDSPVTFAFSRDGSRLASGGKDQIVKVWDAATGRELFSLRGHDDVVQALAFDPSAPVGRLASADAEGAVRFWDAHAGQGPLTLRGHAGGVINMVAFNADGQSLASACQGEGQVLLWDLSSATPRHRLKSLAERLAFTPDGRWLVTAGGKGPGDPGELNVHDARSGQLVRALEGHAAYVVAVAVSPDGQRLVSADANPMKGIAGQVIVHDLRTGKVLDSYQPDVGVVSSLAWHPGGERIAVAGWKDQSVILCGPSGQGPLKLAGHNFTPVVAAFSPDGRNLVTADLGGELIVWDAADGKEVRRLRGHTSLVAGLSFHPRGLRLASASNGMIVRRGTFDISSLRAEVRLWDLPTGREVLVLPGTTAVAFSPDGRRLATVAPSHILEPGTIQVHDATPMPEQH